MSENKGKSFTILQLYPKDMNIYGDWGNTLTLYRRAQWHGYRPKLAEYNPGGTFPEDVAMIVGGGGQDSGQEKIQDDLLKIAPKLTELADQGVPMLMICGLYQLFGKFFKTKEGIVIPGIGLLDIETHGSNQRLIGNIVTESKVFGKIVGYENHSGITYLGPKAAPLATVVKGAGNNGQDQTEGVVYKHVIGSYLHGSLLPKNPAIADWLIEKAAQRVIGEFTPTVIDDSFANEAREIAINRQR